MCETGGEIARKLAKAMKLEDLDERDVQVRAARVEKYGHLARCKRCARADERAPYAMTFVRRA